MSATSVLPPTAAGARDDTLARVKEFWDQNVHNWKVAQHEAGTAAFFEEIEAYRFEKLHYLPKLVDFAGYGDQTVLDVGCGVANDLSRFARGGADVTGIDLSAHAIDLARQNFEQRGLKGEFLVMDGEQMSLPDNHFDMVYCHTVLHFTPNPEKMISEIHRVLKPGKEAILMTLNRHSWLYFMHKVAKVKIDHLDSPVYHRYSIGEFRNMLAPFDDVRIVPERFPVPTKVHGGLKARLFNGGFVSVFNKLPPSWTRRTGHHLIAFCRKT